MKYSWNRPVLYVLALAGVLLLPLEMFARVGGGQSYGGGGGHGSGGGGGGAILWLVFQLMRLLVYLTIEYPIIGIPLDVIILIADCGSLRIGASVGPVAASVRQSQVFQGGGLPLTRGSVSGRAVIDRRDRRERYPTPRESDRR